VPEKSSAMLGLSKINAMRHCHCQLLVPALLWGRQQPWQCQLHELVSQKGQQQGRCVHGWDRLPKWSEVTVIVPSNA